MGTIPPQDPRAAARQAKDYARAQRAYWRYYRGPWGRSIVRPLILIAVGVVALLVETGKVPAAMFWLWIGQWWPVLMIGVGVLLILEYLIDRKNPYAGRGGVGLVLLMILLAIFGWSVHGVQHWGWFGPDAHNFWYMMGPQYDHTVQMDQALNLPKGVTPVVNIDDPRGDVMVTASTDGMIHLRGHQVAHTASQDDANRAFDETKPQIEVTSSGANIVVPANRDMMSDDLTLELPVAAGAVIRSGNGDVTVEGLQGDVDVTARRGDVRVDGLGANVHAKMRNGDFSAHGVKGHTTVEGSGGDITLSEIGGAASIQGEFTGDVHLQKVDGAVTFQSSRTQITVPHLVGELTLDSGDLGMDRASGPIVIKARAKNMDLSAIAGGLQIKDSDGDVNVTTGLPLGAITIENRTGSVRLNVPENASFHIYASTSRDESLSSEFPLTASTENGMKTLQGQVGSGGPKIEIKTTHGSVKLSKGPTAKPGEMRSHVPHFKSSKPVHTTAQ